MGSSLRNKRIFLILALMICTPYVVFAEYDKYPPNFAVTIGEFVYNEDFTPTTDDCTLTVSNPSGSVVLNAVTMNDQADGWHYIRLPRRQSRVRGLRLYRAARQVLER